MNAQERKKVVVIGAGIVGVSTAIWLQRDGHHVTIVDRLGPGEATSYGNGGVLASCACVPVTGPGLIAKAPGMLFSKDGPLYLKWGYLPKLMPWLIKYLRHANEADTRRISAAIHEIIGDSLADHQALAKGTPAEKYVVPTDYLYVYGDKADFESETLSWEIRRRHGFDWEEMDETRLDQRVPALKGSMKFGISLPNHGRISDPGEYVKTLAAHFEAQGGRVVRGQVLDFTMVDGRVTGLATDNGMLECDAVCVCTGAWSARLLKKLGLKIPLETERGYHLELWNPSFMPDMPLMIAAGKFVATPMDGRIRLAGILEFGGLEAPPSEAPFELLERQFRKAFPDVTWQRTEKWMGHRPAPSDSIPVIGEIATAKGVFTGFGHHHVGLTGGPKTGRLLAQLISGNKPNIDLAPYSPMRFT